MKKIILFVLILGIFVLTSCNDEPDYYYDPNPSVNETNDESPKQEKTNDSDESNEEEKKNNNEPGQLNDDGWDGEIF